MATSNVNKIVRGNLGLKPWILSKNPAGIVNSYIQELYKQVPESFKENLFKPRNNVPVVQPRQEKRPTPFRFTIPIVNQTKKTLRPNGSRSSQITINNNFVRAPKKLLNSANFKIYNSRRYSSASSSGASFYRSDFEERRRKQLYKPANGVQQRTYTGTTMTSGSNFYSSPGIAKYIEPTRVFNDAIQQDKCLKITNVICKNLMSVDRTVKEKIRLVKAKPLPKQELPRNSLSGWHHPTLANLNKIHFPITNSTKTVAIPVSPKQRSSAYSMLQAQQPSKTKTYTQAIIPRSPRKENARHQMIPCPYRGFSAKAYNERKYDERNTNQSKKQQPPPQQQKRKIKYSDSEKDTEERVCRSRADRDRNWRGSRLNQRKTNISAQPLRKF